MTVSWGYAARNAIVSSIAVMIPSAMCSAPRSTNGSSGTSVAIRAFVMSIGSPYPKLSQGLSQTGVSAAAANRYPKAVIPSYPKKSQIAAVSRLSARDDLICRARSPILDGVRSSALIWTVDLKQEAQ
jgi:hypothetical protein